MNINKIDGTGKCFRIRRISDGLFSQGGRWYGYSKWSKEGKAWRRIGDLRRHLNEASREQAAEYHADAEIVEYEITITEQQSRSIAQEIYDMQQRKEEERRKRAERNRKFKEDFEKKKLKELMDKYGTDV